MRKVPASMIVTGASIGMTVLGVVSSISTGGDENSVFFLLGAAALQLYAMLCIHSEGK